MFNAAREDDCVEHSCAFEGIVVGLVVGVLVGAAIVATGGLALGPIAMGLTAAGAIGLGGKEFGSALSRKDEKVEDGSPTVQIGKHWAARAKVDKVNKHKPQVVAQGSRRVFIDGYPAARLEDKTECGGKIAEGCATVQIGQEPGTYVHINSEVPWQLELVANLLMLGGSALSIVAELRAASAAAKLAQTEKAALTSAEETTASAARAEQQTCAGEPVDVATGAVVSAQTDFSLPGPIPVEWKRYYSSANASNVGALGAGGWVHSFEQWVDLNERVTLRDGEGRDVYFGIVALGESKFHTGDRLRLTRELDGSVTVYSPSTRLTRTFRGERSRLRLSEIRDSYHNVIHIAYDGDRLNHIIDAVGRELRVETDALGRVTRVEIWARRELRQWVDYVYHASGELGELSRVVNAAGDSHSFAYDEQHRLTKQTFPNGVSFYYEHDDRLGRCVRTWGDQGIHTCILDYDVVGGTTHVSGGERPTVYHWIPQGLVIREETPDGQCLLVREYDAALHLVAEGPCPARITRYKYDTIGNLIEQTDAAGNSTTWVFADDVPSERRSPDGLVTRYEHDERGALVSVTPPIGLTRRIGRDAHGRVTSVGEGDVALVRFAYDSEHNLVEEVSARGARIRYAYDPLGQVAEEVDSLGRARRARYDVLGRPVEIVAPDGGVTRLEYDSLGNITRVTDAMGGTTELFYQGTGVLKRVCDAIGEVWHLCYDKDERLVELLNPSLERYAFEYDNAGRVRWETTFDGRRLGYRYDEGGLLRLVDYPDRTFREFKRNVLGSIVKEETREDNIIYEHDALGRLTSATLVEMQGKVVTRFERDAFGRVVSESQNGQEIRFSYDTRGYRAQRLLPKGQRTEYERDALGAVIAVIHQEVRFEIERDELGRETRRRAAGDELTIEREYDPLDRLAELRFGRGSIRGSDESRSFRYDLLGRPVQIDDSRLGKTLYRYDEIGQLIEATRGNAREVLRYDVTRSLSGLFRGLITTDSKLFWNTDNGNLLLQTGAHSYTYDTRGRRTSKTPISDGGSQERGVTTFAWDVRDRLREVVTPNGDRVRFMYDAFGRRIRKEVVGDDGRYQRTVDFLWDGDVLAADRNGDQDERVFVHEPGTFIPMLQAEQGQVFAVVTDHLGMPQDLLHTSGRVAWSASHSVWGRIEEEWTTEPWSVQSPFRLLGQYHDEETGLCYTRFRYFDADVGRWCSPDPLGLAGGLNLNGFDGAPTTVIDPLGLMCPVATKGGSELPRFNGPKPRYTVNDAHVPGRGLRPGKTPLPADAESVFSGAIPNDPVNPTAWFGKNSEGQIYRFSLGNDGTAHFSGIHGVGDGTRNITPYTFERLGGQ